MRDHSVHLHDTELVRVVQLGVTRAKYEVVTQSRLSFLVRPLWLISLFYIRKNPKSNEGGRRKTT